MRSGDALTAGPTEQARGSKLQDVLGLLRPDQGHLRGVLGARAAATCPRNSATAPATCSCSGPTAPSPTARICGPARPARGQLRAGHGLRGTGRRCGRATTPSARSCTARSLLEEGDLLKLFRGDLLLRGVPGHHGPGAGHLSGNVTARRAWKRVQSKQRPRQREPGQPASPRRARSRRQLCPPRHSPGDGRARKPGTCLSSSPAIARSSPTGWVPTTTSRWSRGGTAAGSPTARAAAT